MAGELLEGSESAVASAAGGVEAALDGG